MKAASSSQRVGDTRPCARGPYGALHRVRAGSRPAVALPAGGVGGPSASSCFAEASSDGGSQEAVSYPGRTCRDSGAKRGEPGNVKCACRPFQTPRRQSRPPAPSLTVQTGPASLQPRAGVSQPQTVFSFWEAGETPGSQASSNSSHQSFRGEAGARPRLEGLQAHGSSGARPRRGFGVGSGHYLEQAQLGWAPGGCLQPHRTRGSPGPPTPGSCLGCHSM